jgi:hypothetical protein
MMTLGCGGRLDRVPSGQMIASSDSNPRLPSSQLTASPSRVQACASAGQAVLATIADIRIENTSPPIDGDVALRLLNRRYRRSSSFIGFRFKSPGSGKPASAEI